MGAHTNHTMKLAAVQRLENAGILKSVTIVSFRSNCPFCSAPDRLIINISSHSKGATYACIACGESGLVSEMQANLEEVKPPVFTKRRRDKVTQPAGI